MSIIVIRLFFLDPFFPRLVFADDTATGLSTIGLLDS